MMALARLEALEGRPITWLGIVSGSLEEDTGVLFEAKY